MTCFLVPLPSHIHSEQYKTRSPIPDPPGSQTGKMNLWKSQNYFETKTGIENLNPGPRSPWSASRAPTPSWPRTLAWPHNCSVWQVLLSARALVWNRFGWDLFCSCLYYIIHNVFGTRNLKDLNFQVQMRGWGGWRPVQQASEEGSRYGLLVVVGVEVFTIFLPYFAHF